MKFTLFAGGALALAMMMTANAAGQDKTPHLDTLISMSRAEVLVPRPALQPVKSIDPTSAAATDTRADRHKIHRRATAHDRHALDRFRASDGHASPRLVCLTP